MARQRKLTPERKALIQSLLSHYKPEDAQDVQAMLRDLLGDTIQQMLEAEMDDHLGYSKYDYKNKHTDDSRNGYSPKTVTSSAGDIPIDVPRDRKGDFEPQSVKKNQTDISNIEDQVLSMYAKGMTTRDISAHLQSIYGVDASAEMISRMTDRILPIAKEWQNRPLAKKYAVVFMDAVHFNVRQDGRTVKKAVYVAIGTRLDGHREVLGLWVGGNESAKYWVGVLNEIRNRGTEDIFIISVDGLTGFADAISAVYPKAEVQRCIVHQIRYTTKFVSYKDINAFMNDLKVSISS
ncbi:transposase, partial [Synergistes jonesii]